MSVGLWVLELACVNEHHSALFQSHSGTFSEHSPFVESILKIRALIAELSSLKE